MRLEDLNEELYSLKQGPPLRQLSLDFAEEPKALAVTNFGNSNQNHGNSKASSKPKFGRNTTQQMCSYSGKVGHTVDEDSREEVPQLSDLSLSQDQIQGLMTLLQSQLHHASSSVQTTSHNNNQDKQSKKRIGYGKEKHGLYELQSSISSNKASLNL
ncbi:hypothetical protein PIB30_082146, partial [Stylosanthes scabra]|nr:hypothetical protein [Stylosanthes scabra]